MARGVDKPEDPTLRVEVRIGVAGVISFASGPDVTARGVTVGGIALPTRVELNEEYTFIGLEWVALSGDCSPVLTDAAGAFEAAAVFFCVLTKLGCVDRVDLTIRHINNQSRKRWMKRWRELTGCGAVLRRGRYHSPVLPIALEGVFGRQVDSASRVWRSHVRDVDGVI